MADDIDIEEHDVFENPRIKKMFPDIANIKLEVNDFDEDCNLLIENSYNYAPFSGPTMEVACEFEQPGTYSYKTILGSKPSTSGFKCEQDLLTVHEPAPNQESEDEYEYEDSSEEDEVPPKILPSSVLLKDWGQILESNPCYCNECKILFPTKNAIDSHRMVAHSFLVAVSRNKAMKSTGKSSLIQPSVLSDNERVCSHCNKVFPDENALLKHSYELFPTQFSPETSKQRKSLGNTDLLEFCSICTCIFATNNGLLLHAKTSHNMTEIEPKLVKFSSKCAYCPTLLSAKGIYNTHIKRFHSEHFFKKIVSKTKLGKDFKCSHCELSFPSAYSEKIHRATQHRDLSEYKSVFKSQNSLKTVDINRPVPKSTLFKCNKCQIHFIMCSVAIDHSKRCSLSKGEWKCQECRRSFKYVDKRVHLKQHELTDRFTVIVVDDDLLKRIICRCTSCEVCFDERTFLKLHSIRCIDTRSFVCSICHLKINELSLSKHSKYHTQLKNSEFILVNFVCGPHNGNKSKAIAPIIIQLIYCNNCKCYSKKMKTVSCHRLGTCDTESVKILCNICGLQFTRKGIVSHKLDHKRVQLRLNNFTITDVMSGERISPPLPDFHLCGYCNVYFVSLVALKGHTCNSDEHKVCKYCSKTFSDLAFKLHMPFHDDLNNQKGNIPELMMKYESLKSSWNILYKCKHCDIVTDNYDKAVEHCQDHICGVLDYRKVVQCETCKFSMFVGCYNRHQKLHVENNVTRRSFDLLDYDHNLLLTEDWLDIFDRFSEQQVKQILSKSIYTVTRCIRMELVTNGSPDMTLYLCKICNTFVEPANVLEHSNSDTCPSASISYSCSLCDFNFLTDNLAQEHKNLHLTKYASKKSFRIIAFHNRTNAINNALLMYQNMDEFKFIRCQHCGKLIKKLKYQIHIQTHLTNKNNPVVNFTNRKNKVENLQYQMKRSLVSKCYTCSICNISCFKKYLHSHICSKSKMHCVKCQMWFRTKSFNKHRKLHLKYPNLTRKTFSVVYYKNGVIENTPDEPTVKMKTIKLNRPVKPQFNNANKTILRLYQCTECNSCLHNKYTTARHLCSPKHYLTKCKLCHLYFFGSQMNYHQQLHKKKLITRKNINIVEFKGKNGVLINKVKGKEIVPKTEYTPRQPRRRTAVVSGEETVGLPITNRPSSTSIRIRVYKCGTCNLNFVPRLTLIEHMEACLGDKEVGKVCEYCGIEYHPIGYKSHSKSTKCGIETRKIIPRRIKVSFRGSDASVDSNWVYHCSKCDLYYVTYGGLFNHMANNHNTREPYKYCETCGVNFASRSYNHHVFLHHTSSQIPFCNLNVEEFTDDFMTFTKAISHSNVEKTPSLNIKETAKSDETQEEGVAFLYKCRICNVLFIHVSSLVTHYIRKKHNQTYNFCSICNLKFTIKTLAKHEAMHKIYNEFKIIDNIHNHYIETELAEYVEDVKLNDSEIANDTAEESIDMPIDKTVIDETDENIATKAFYCAKCDVNYFNENFDPCNEYAEETKKGKGTIYNLYKCHICDLHFNNRDTLYTHIIKKVHKTSRVKCDKCLLDFTPITLSKHKVGHNLYQGYKIITKPVTMDNDESNISDDKSDSINNDNTNNYKEVEDSVKGNLDSSEIGEIKANINEESNAFNVRSNDASSYKAPSLPDRQERTEFKLYKCSECDVCFLDEETCQDHCQNHAVLHPTEYIACKICDLQFLCESLGRHMKGHRNKTFNIEDLIVSEYRRNGDGIEIDTYSAADAMRLKQVTTTTHSDND